ARSSRYSDLGNRGVRIWRRGFYWLLGGKGLIMEAAVRFSIAHSERAGTLRFARWNDASESWLRFANSTKDATLYHHAPCVRLLQSAQGLQVEIAPLARAGETVAGCLLANSSRFSRRLVSLTDSEFCPPLAVDAGALEGLLQALADHPRSRRGLEIHGVSANSPWQNVDIFSRWSVDLRQPAEALERKLHADVRRNSGRALERGVSVSHGTSLEDVRRFYALHLTTRRRLGVPPRPFRYFKLFWEIFSAVEGLEIWIASHHG